MVNESTTSLQDDNEQLATLRSILAGFEVPGLPPVKIRQLSARIREMESTGGIEFFRAAAYLVQSEADSEGRRRLGAILVKSPGFLSILCDRSYFTHEKRLQVCERLMQSDGLLDVQLAHQLPGLHNQDCVLEPGVVVSLLEILDRISPRERLIPVLQHLTRHEDMRIASRAALLLGHRVRNPRWIERHLTLPDPRLRANVVEGLWGSTNPVARAAVEACLHDENNRVVGNALFGLHMLGDGRVPGRLLEMIVDSRAPFRQTAAWLMGKIASTEFEQPLRQALTDPDSGVRTAAQRALDLVGKKPEAEPPDQVGGGRKGA
jgi:HEAT repeats